jgi:hypothetical protein
MEKLSKDEAEELLTNWADCMELDTDSELFEDAKDELSNPVKLQKLTFDPETEIFSLQLIKPVTYNDGKEIHIIEIKECDFESKRVLQKYKENESIASACAVISSYISQPISIVNKLKDRDINRINAVIMCFITQTQVKKK